MNIRQELLNHIETLGYSFDNKNVALFIKEDLDMMIGEVKEKVSTIDEIKRWIPKVISWKEAA